MSAAKDLPEDIIFEILTYLPPKSVARCKSVAKPWRARISEPQFTKARLDRQKKKETTELRNGVEGGGPLGLALHKFSDAELDEINFMLRNGRKTGVITKVKMFNNEPEDYGKGMQNREDQ